MIKANSIKRRFKKFIPSNCSFSLVLSSFIIVCVFVQLPSYFMFLFLGIVSLSQSCGLVVFMNSRKILTLFPQIFPGLPLFWAHFICKLGCLKLSYSYLMLSSFSFLPLHVHFSRLHIHSIATSSVSLIFPLFFNTYLFPHSVFHHRLLFSSPEVSCDYKSFVFNLFSLSCTLLNIRNTVIIAN